MLEASFSSQGALALARAFGAAGRGKKVEEASQAGALHAGFTLTVVLCYEALFPGIVAARRAPESVAIVNLADDGWIGGATATRQLAAFARFRAIEQRLPFVRVAHGGLSVAVDPLGEPILELPENTWAHGRIEVRASPPPGFVEKVVLVALPLVTGAGVWWLLRGWARRGAGEVGTGRPRRGGNLRETLDRRSRAGGWALCRAWARRRRGCRHLHARWPLVRVVRRPAVPVPADRLDDSLSLRHAGRGRHGVLHDPARRCVDRADSAAVGPGDSRVPARGASLRLHDQHFGRAEDRLQRGGRGHT